MLERAEGLKERATEKNKPGTLLDFLVPLSNDAKQWEISFALHLSRETSARLKAKSVLNTNNTIVAMPVGNVQMPVFLLRLDNSEDLSFACMLRVDLCGEKRTEFESLDYINILNSQKNIFVEEYVEGSYIGKFAMTNQNSGRSLLTISELVNKCLRKEGQIAYSMARTDLHMSFMFEAMKRKELAGLSEDEKFGRLMWELYTKSVG
jgi:hypothetical protein